MQRKGLVLVGGAFDPLHPGHLAYLSLARDYGGPVLCAVANDATVAKKHPPLQSDHDRAAILDRFVEYVTIPDAGGMPVVLSRLQPKAYLKGDDWEGRLPADEVEVCHRIGIPVVYTHLRTHSSSLILADYQRRLEAAALERFQAFVAAQRQPEP